MDLKTDHCLQLLKVRVLPNLGNFKEADRSYDLLRHPRNLSKIICVYFKTSPRYAAVPDFSTSLFKEEDWAEVNHLDLKEFAQLVWSCLESERPLK